MRYLFVICIRGNIAILDGSYIYHYWAANAKAKTYSGLVTSM